MVAVHAPILLMLNKAAQIIPGNGFQGGPTLLLRVTLGLLKLRVVWDFLLRNLCNGHR